MKAHKIKIETYMKVHKIKIQTYMKAHQIKNINLYESS